MKRIIFNAVASRHLRKIAEAITDAVDIVARRHNLETDFGGDDFAYSDILIPIETAIADTS